VLCFPPLFWSWKMESAVSFRQVFRFGLFEADVARATLTRKGARVRIQDQPFRVLLLLLERPGEIITREELRRKLWPEGTFVDFDGSLNVILKKLRAALDDDSDNPRFIETVPRRGYRFIAPVTTERILAAQPSSAGAVAAVDPAGPGIQREASAGSLARTAPKPHLYALLAALFVIAVFFVWYARRDFFRARTNTPQSAPAAAPVLRQSVAVLSFHNLSGKANDGWLATALSEMLSTELAAGERLRLVSGEDVANLRLSSPWSETDTLGQQTTARIGTALSSDVLVLGSYASVGKPERRQLRLDVRLQDARTGQILAEVAEIGSSESFFQLISRIGAKLRDRLGVPGVAENDEPGILASLPSNPEAARFYTLGLTKLRQFDALPAKDLLVQAETIDPKFALVHVMLARAWALLGYEQKRKDEAKRALDLASNLPRVSRMLVEGDYYESLAQHEKAASTYQALFELFPDSVEYGLLLAYAQTAAGHPSQASETTARLRRLPSPASLDPRIDLAEALNERSVGQYEPAEKAAARAAAKARTNGLDLILASALYRQGENLSLLGQGDKAIAAAEEAKSIYSRTGDQFGVSAALSDIGNVQWLRGEYEAAEKIFQQKLVTDSNVGNKTSVAKDLRFIASARAMRGDLGGARQQYQRALAIYREIKDRPHVAYTLIEVAWTLDVSGDPAATPRLYDEALAIFRDMSNEEGVAEVLAQKGNTLVTLGQLSAAEESCHQALELYRKTGEKNLITRVLFDLGNIASVEDKREESRKTFSEALAIDREVHDAGAGVTVELGLANLEQEEGRSAEARKLLDDIFSYLHAHKDPNQEISAQCQLAEIALKQGNAAEAKSAMDAARKLVRPGQWLEERYTFEITNARFQAANGNPRGARQSLKAVVADATKHDYVHYQLEAGLALCEVEAKTDPAAARLDARALEKQARAKGFAMIARKALALAN
jgi:DNA-binding winged helix-turn-helix (wHTH) protein/tetratricopeptide (TPR) repeat protein